MTRNKSGLKINPMAIVVAAMIFGFLGVTLWWYGGGNKIETSEMPGIMGPPSAPGKDGGSKDADTDAGADSRQDPIARDLLKPKGKGKEAGPDFETLALGDGIADVAETAMPSVVNVFTEKEMNKGPTAMGEHPFFHHFFGPGGRPPERKATSLGSGVIVSADGYILTNNHVVEDAKSIKVALSDKSEYEAELVGSDPATDLAVLKIDARGLEPIDMGDSDKVRVGQVVLAIGNPFGLSRTVTMGIVSARGRSRVGLAEYEDYIQTDAAINPGNSGGALINLRGELIGVNSAIVSRSGGYMGIGLAIPAKLAGRIMEDLIEKGHVTRGWLGVGVQDITPELAEYMGLDKPEGGLVAEVYPDTPAASAGVEPGDIIVSVGGREVSDNVSLRNAVAAIEPGDRVTIEVVREKKKVSLDVTLSERPGPGELRDRLSPEAIGPDATHGVAGMEVAEVTEDLARRYGLGPAIPAGVIVVEVERGGRAEKAGVREGDLILKINRLRVKSLADFEKAAGGADDNPVPLLVLRGRAKVFILVPPG